MSLHPRPPSLSHTVLHRPHAKPHVRPRESGQVSLLELIPTRGFILRRRADLLREHPRGEFEHYEDYEDHDDPLPSVMSSIESEIDSSFKTSREIIICSRSIGMIIDLAVLARWIRYAPVFVQTYSFVWNADTDWRYIWMILFWSREFEQRHAPLRDTDCFILITALLITRCPRGQMKGRARAEKEWKRNARGSAWRRDYCGLIPFSFSQPLPAHLLIISRWNRASPNAPWWSVLYLSAYRVFPLRA